MTKLPLRIFVTPSGITRFVIAQFWNAYLPMLFHVTGKDTLASAVQFLNVNSPIYCFEASDFSHLNEVNAVQLSKALF